MSKRTIAIGDVHGCRDSLQGIIDLVNPTADDTLVVLGDCIDRGPDSRGVLDLLLELGDRCQLVTLLGNHEEMLLAAVDRPGTAGMWLECGGRETLASYDAGLARELPREHLLFIRTWQDYWENDTHFFAHANYAPEVTLDRQEWGYQRWQSLKRTQPKPHVSGKVAILGHTSQKSGEVLDRGHLQCIDTYCYGGKWLTALDPQSGECWQVDPKGNPRAS